MSDVCITPPCYPSAGSQSVPAVPFRVTLEKMANANAERLLLSGEVSRPWFSTSPAKNDGVEKWPPAVPRGGRIRVVAGRPNEVTMERPRWDPENGQWRRGLAGGPVALGCCSEGGGRRGQRGCWVSGRYLISPVPELKAEPCSVSVVFLERTQRLFAGGGGCPGLRGDCVNMSSSPPNTARARTSQILILPPPHPPSALLAEI